MSLVELGKLKDAKRSIDIGDYDKARVYIEQTFSEIGPSRQSLYLKIELEEALHNHKEVIKTCDLLLMFDPLNRKCHESKLKALKALGNFEYISSYLEKSMKLFPAMIPE